MPIRKTLFTTNSHKNHTFPCFSVVPTSGCKINTTQTADRVSFQYFSMLLLIILFIWPQNIYSVIWLSLWHSITNSQITIHKLLSITLKFCVLYFIFIFLFLRLIICLTINITTFNTIIFNNVVKNHNKNNSKIKYYSNW